MTWTRDQQKDVVGGGVSEHTPSERSVTKSSMDRLRAFSLSFSLSIVSEGSSEGGVIPIPFSEGLLLHINPLLLDRQHLGGDIQGRLTIMVGWTVRGQGWMTTIREAERIPRSVSDSERSSTRGVQRFGRGGLGAEDHPSNGMVLGPSFSMPMFGDKRSRVFLRKENECLPG